MIGRPITQIAEIPQKLRDAIHCAALFGLISQKSHNNCEIEGTDAGNAEAAMKGDLVTPSTTWWMGWKIRNSALQGVQSLIR
jgi:hypothetical protein